jgi:adenylate cyclase
LPLRHSECLPTVAIEGWKRGRTHHHAQTTSRQLRILTLVTRIAAAVSVLFGIQQFVIIQSALWIGVVNLTAAAVFLAIPKLYRFGEVVGPLVFVAAAYTMITVVSIYIGSGIGLQFYFVVAAAIVVLVFGIDHMAIASAVAGIGALTVIALDVWVPHSTGIQPDWAFRLGFIVNTIAVWVLIVATVWFSLRETERAERAMDAEFQRSESLLANILPATIAERLKNPAHTIIADKYDDASILFADIAGYTERASDTSPTDLVRFLDALYTDLDALVDKHGLEKIKTTGDSYMVVMPGAGDERNGQWPQGLPWPRGATAHGHGRGPGGRRSRRGAEVLLRRLGRRRERRRAHGVHRHRGPHPGSPRRVRTAQRPIRVRGPWRDRRQGQGRHAHVVSDRAPSELDIARHDSSSC